MSSTTVQYQASERGGKFILVSISKPTPGPDEVSIRLKVIGLNSLDWKRHDFGLMVDRWPVTFGIDGAGVVEEVGDNVSAVKPGDEVFGLFGLEDRASSFQEVAVVPEHCVVKKPSNISTEDAASLSISFITALSAVYDSLGISLPYLSEASTNSGSKPNSVLVLGGSSGVGGAAIQILRIALPSATIITTCSTKHNDRIMSLGATKTVDRSSSSIVEDIRAASPNGKGVDMIFDAVSSAASQPELLNGLDPQGMKEVAEVITGQAVEVPEGVKKHMVMGRKVFGAPGGRSSMAALAQMIREGKYLNPLRTETVGHGLESIAGGLLQMKKKGVSGTKLLVTV